MASRVQHIMRLSVQDWRTSKVRMRSAVTGDRDLRLVYLEILIALYEGGGQLPSDTGLLADVLALPEEVVERCLPILAKMVGDGRGGIVVGDGVISNPRVTEDLADEERYREQQAESGRRGGQARAKGRQVQPKRSLSPPAPTPLPTPTPSTAESCAEPNGSPPPPVLEFLTHTGQPWGLTPDKLAEYQDSFPNLDVLSEFRRARQWCIDHPAERKTERGMPAFLGRWLTKATDSPRRFTEPGRKSSSTIPATAGSGEQAATVVRRY